MTINRSRLYEKLADETFDEYMVEPTHPRTRYWFKKIAPKWRNRVGLPRLTAERAFFEAAGLLRSVNPGLFRNESEEMKRLYGAAVNAAQELAGEFSRENWQRFEGKESKHDQQD